MKVTLRIVGLYFNAPVEIDDANYPNGVSVKDVLDEYIKNHPISKPTGLSYSVKEDYEGPKPIRSSVLSLSHYYEGRYDFNADGKLNDGVDGRTLSGSTRAAGLYKLQEGTIPGVAEGVLGWQYYVETKGTGVRKSQTGPERGFDPFDVVPTEPAQRIADGDVITWRMVAILLGPSVQGKQPLNYASGKGAEETAKSYTSS